MCLLVSVIPGGQGRPTAGPGSSLVSQLASDALHGAVSAPASADAASPHTASPFVHNRLDAM